MGCCRCGCCADYQDQTYEFDRVKTILPLHVIMRGMAQGTIMYKIRAPDRWYRRKYKVDLQNMRLTYSPSSKPLLKEKFTSIFKCSSQQGNSSVDLFNLEDVRKGWNSDVFNRLQAKFRRHPKASFNPQLRSMLREENCFTLILGPSHTVVDLIAPNVHTRDAWIRGLNQLIACCKTSQKKVEADRWLKEQVRKADVNGNGSLNFEECLLLLNQLNISMSKSDAKSLFDNSNFRKEQLDGEDALDPEEFVHFYHSLANRPELENLMKQYSLTAETVWGPEELQTFLHKEQMVEATMDECIAFIEKFEPEENRIEGYMSLKGFQEMLLSVEFNIFNKKHRLIYQDMTHPLSHYYIASSHNTYLINGQLIGVSSIEGYIKALQEGCRCLELDTWDGPYEEPIIFHGYTFTSRILLRDVLEAIRQYAFTASQYPVILSLENHCSPVQQVRMARHLQMILGDYLYTKPIGEKEIEYPSPEKLARKILIKAHKLRTDESAEDKTLEDEEEEETALATTIAAALKYPADDDSIHPHLASAKTITKELSELVNYCSAKRFHNFDNCRVFWKFNEMASFQETTALDLGSTIGPQFVGFNKKHLSRVYPKGTRTDSSNYDPIPYWNFGCQLVALNYQTRDDAMYVYDSKFAQNGRCGYILKPKFLRDHEVPYHPYTRPHPGYKRLVVIKVISGQCLPKPGKALEGEVVDPYVSIKVYGHPLDAQKKKTKSIHNNGFNPMWDESFLLTLNSPETDMLHFRVKDQKNTGKNELLGQFAMPFTSITEGYRHVHLQDAEGKPLVPATILVHVENLHTAPVAT